MTLGSLFAIIGIALAVYALASPSQRKSISLFVPPSMIWLGLSISVIFFLAVEVLTQWEVQNLGLIFCLGFFALLTLIGFTVIALHSWHNAKLSKRSDNQFKEFLLSCIRENSYGEAVRIITCSRSVLATHLSAETISLLFDRKFVRAMIASRTWLHLELLADQKLLDIHPRYYQAVDCTIRELIEEEESPLRIAVLSHESGDDTARPPTISEQHLIGATFDNPEWFLRCGIEQPLVMIVNEKVGSGQFREQYNTADSTYGLTHGITPRSKCPLFLAIKTITRTLVCTATCNTATVKHTDNSAAALYNIFTIIHQDSKYREDTWEGFWGYGDYATPYGYLLAEIISDYRRICIEYWSKSRRGEVDPPEPLAPVVTLWAACVHHMQTHADTHVSPDFRKQSLITILEFITERHQDELNASNDDNNATPWSTFLIESIKPIINPNNTNNAPLKNQIEQMDIGKPHILNNKQWLISALVD